MTKTPIAILLVSAALLCGRGLYGQGPRVTDALPGINLTGLSAAQRASVYKVLTTKGCSCGCTMTIAECRVKDLTCYYSRGLSTVIVEAIRSGKSEAEAVKLADASVYAHPPVDDGRVLSDAIQIPTRGAPEMGPVNAAITLVEFSDFQCPYCILAAPEVEKVVKAYPTQVRLIFKQFPLEMHSAAALAAAASVAADKQGKFWPMHDGIFAQRGRLSRDVIVELASHLGVDMKRFVADMDAQETMAAVVKDEEDGYNAGVMGTPTVFVNGQRYNKTIQLEALKPVIDGELKKKNAAPAVHTVTSQKPS